MPEKTLRPEDVPEPPPGGTGIRTARGTDGDRVWVQVTRKVNLGKYEILEVGCGSSVSLEPGETVSAGLKRVGAVVRAEFAELLEVVREDAEI